MSDPFPARRLADEPAEIQSGLFDIAPDWHDYWWGMPSFSMGDARPTKTIAVNFLTRADFIAFCDKLGIRLSDKSDTMWWPTQEPLSGEFEYDGPKVSTRYPVCIPSKGRADCQRTGRALDAMGVDYKFFVEETEYDAYCAALGEARVFRLPFYDLGLGSIPARNEIWEWAALHGHARHWVMDDNIVSFARCTMNRRLCVRSGMLFRAIEDFADRYENIAIAGPHHKGFVMDRDPSTTPVLWNSRVYSCMLIDTALGHRWRGRYNEDTDLCLRILKGGLCTALFRALLMDKGTTVGVRNAKPMPGGNHDSIYAEGDSRRAFAESLREQHPDIVEVVWKFNRWHHQVDYSAFRKNRPRLRPGVVPTRDENEYGLELRRA